MGKYDSFKILRKKVASTTFRCQLCRAFVNEGNDYFSEEVTDRFLHSLHKRKFCVECVQRFKNQMPPIVS